MRSPLIVSVGHRRTIETVLGQQVTSTMNDEYLRGLRQAGASPAILAPGAHVPEAVVDSMEGLLLTGGGDINPALFGSSQPGSEVDHERDEMEVELVRLCHSRRIPVLGMCRGNQVLTVALGGSLQNVEDHVQQEPMSKPVHTVGLQPRSRVAEVLGEEAVAVNTFHRWAVDTLAKGFTVSGTSDDGVVEAIEWEADDWFAIGIQWHAELLDTPHVEALFEGFVQAARK